MSIDAKIDENAAKHPETSLQHRNPQIASAIAREGASFELLIKVLSKAEKAHEENPNSDEYQAHLEDCGRIFELFEKEYGKITQLYICKDHKTAAVLTDKPNFFSEYRLGENYMLENLLIKIDRLATETDRLLRGHDRKQCITMIYSVATKTLRLIDTGIHKETVDVKKTIKIVEQQLEIAKKYHERAAKLSAQFDYFTGTLLGLTFLFLISAVIRFIVAQSGNSIMFIPADILVPILLSGGIGAIISVMSRISSRRLVLDFEASRRILTLVGFFRPIIGAVFGVAIYALLESTLVDSIVNMPSNDNRNIFYLIVGFLAGFSERFAPDMLDTASATFAGKTQEPINEDSA